MNEGIFGMVLDDEVLESMIVCGFLMFEFGWYFNWIVFCNRNFLVGYVDFGEMDSFFVNKCGCFGYWFWFGMFVFIFGIFFDYW